MAAFLTGMLGPLTKKLEDRQEKEEARKKELRQFYLKALADPDVSDEARKEAENQLGKLLHPDSKKGLAKIAPIIGKLASMHGKKKEESGGGPARAPQVPAQQPAADQQAGTTQESAAPPAATPPPPAAPGGMAGIYSGHGEAREKRHLAQQQELERTKADQKIREQAAKPATAGTRKPVKFKTEDGTEIFAQQDSRTGTYYDMQNRPMEIPEGATPVEKTTQTNMQKTYFRYPGEQEDALPHMAWVDPRNPNKRVDASTMQPVPEGAIAVDETAVTAKIRGQFYGTGEYTKLKRALVAQGYSDQEAELYAGQTIEEEVKRRVAMIGAPRTREVLGVSGGESVAVPLTSTPRPRPMAPTPPPGVATPPTAQAPPATAPPQSGPPAAAGATPRAPVPGSGGAAPATPAKAPVAPAVPTGAGASRKIDAVPAGQYRGYLNDIRAIRTASTQLFGDPTQPELKGLDQYMPLADDLGARKRLGQALRLTFDGMDQATGGGHATVGAGGLSLGVGGVATWLQNKWGVPAEVAQQQARIMQKSIASLTPNEREAYDAIISSFEAVVGLRSLTRASAAQSSVRAIQEMLPVIGVNTTDSKQFADRMQRLGAELTGGARGIPKAAMDPETRQILDDIEKLPGRTNKMKGGPAKAPKSATMQDVRDFAKEHKMSEAEARKAFEAKGYTIAK